MVGEMGFWGWGRRGREGCWPGRGCGVGRGGWVVGGRGCWPGLVCGAEVVCVLGFYVAGHLCDGFLLLLYTDTFENIMY